MTFIIDEAFPSFEDSVIERDDKEQEMNLLFEDMIRVETDKYVCRIWRGKNDGAMTNNALSVLARDYLVYDTDFYVATRNIAEIDGVNSVEVVDRATGCGVCVHKDWP